MKNIGVFSFDHDECLCHRDYRLSKDRDLLRHNKLLLDDIRFVKTKYTMIKTYVGSSRQSFYIDQINNNQGKGSAFTAIQTVSSHLDSELEPFLLADLYEDLADGTSFARAIDSSYEGPHAHWIFDESKATILFAQIHHAALRGTQEDRLTFHFYDNNLNILNGLKFFYARFPELLPDTVCLQLHLYYGKTSPTAFFEIIGKGSVDKNYRQTVKDMATTTCELMGLASLSDFYKYPPISTAKYFHPRFLNYRLLPSAKVDEHSISYLLEDEVEDRGRSHSPGLFFLPVVHEDLGELYDEHRPTSPQYSWG